MPTRLRKTVFLMIKDGALYKSKRFREFIYVGDPLNTIRIFNDFQVDELIIVDVDATTKQSPIQFEMLGLIAKHARMPIAYGGGINDTNQIERILNLGFEKIVISKHAIMHPSFVLKASSIFGSQAVIVCIDLKYCRKKNTYEIFTDNGQTKAKVELNRILQDFVKYKAGEILINSIDADGTYKGYKSDILNQINVYLPMPITLLGGGASNSEIEKLMKEKSIHLAAGSLWTFYNKTNAVLLNYPERVDEASTIIQ